MLDKSKIGHVFPPFTVEVEKGRLKFFAKAIGETNPVYTDEAAALKAGYRSLPAPPTFTSVLDQESPDFLPVLGLLDIDIARILHGTQAFEYFAPICAGDTIRVEGRITDIFDKKGGALEFVVMESTYTNQDGQLTTKATSTLVVRNS
jgi:acyl dehydratase